VIGYVALQVAEYLSIIDRTVQLKRIDNGKVLTLRLEQFSLRDQPYLVRLASSELDD
jgi:hypothetical protein